MASKVEKQVQEVLDEIEIGKLRKAVQEKYVEANEFLKGIPLGLDKLYKKKSFQDMKPSAKKEQERQVQQTFFDAAVIKHNQAQELIQGQMAKVEKRFAPKPPPQLTPEQETLDLLRKTEHRAAVADAVESLLDDPDFRTSQAILGEYEKANQANDRFRYEVVCRAGMKILKGVTDRDAVAAYMKLKEALPALNRDFDAEERTAALKGIAIRIQNADQGAKTNFLLALEDQGGPRLHDMGFMPKPAQPTEGVVMGQD